MSKFFSFSLYYTSFFPLWVSVIFIDLKNTFESINNTVIERISVFSIMTTFIICFFILKNELNIKTKEGTRHYIIQSAIEEKNITVEYLLSYILPLFAFDFTTWDGVILFLIFFSTLGFLCIKHNNFSVNIILELLGYNFYSCKLKNEDKIEVERIVISKKNLTGCPGDDIYLKSLNNEYKLEIQ